MICISVLNISNNLVESVDRGYFIYGHFIIMPISHKASIFN